LQSRGRLGSSFWLRIDGSTLTAAIVDGTAWEVMTETQFGFISTLRLVCVVVTACLLLLLG
jgi:hypothetical protein